MASDTITCPECGTTHDGYYKYCYSCMIKFDRERQERERLMNEHNKKNKNKNK